MIRSSDHGYSRRRALARLVAFSAAMIVGCRSAARDGATVRPVCSFSIEHGWGATALPRLRGRPAVDNDPSGVPQIIERIGNSLAIEPELDLDIYLSQGDNNAFAAVSNGRRVIVVDVGFLERLNEVARTDWAAIQVIAHEVGHHIAGFQADRLRGELQADYWSGQVLHRLGSARDAAQRAILTVGTNFDTPTHPNKRDRAMAIGQGWDDSSMGVVDYSFCLDCR